ncbi:MAG: ATP-binding protein, partial [Thermovirgaceae bacterium]|nr:ATP-binding protein [Thermovirgaceae bacterium]
VTFTALDITFQKRLESQLQQVQKMEAIGTLAGGIAHDFNNILGAIMGYAEMALLDASEEHKVRYCVDQVLKASYRAKDLVKQILAFSRQSDQEKRPLQITPIVKETLKMLRAFIPATIEIRHRLEADSAIVEADPTHIHQILMNLSTNAQYAMHDKGGILEISLRTVDLNPDEAAGHADLKPGSYLELSVSDTGDGMDPETRERIFDPYFTTKKKGVGTGMGLAVVHGIVKDHRGAITVQSELGKGTQFDVFFPIADKPVKAAGNEFKPLPGGTEHILLVDDEEPLVRLVKGMLEKLGYRVSARSSSLEALEAFRAHPDRFDLVITDMTMPNMTGEILAQKLMAVRPSIPVVLCTGYSERVTDTKVKSLGIRELIMKPILIREMAFTLRRILDGE